MYVQKYQYPLLWVYLHNKFYYMLWDYIAFIDLGPPSLQMKFWIVSKARSEDTKFIGMKFANQNARCQGQSFTKKALDTKWCKRRGLDPRRNGGVHLFLNVDWRMLHVGDISHIILWISPLYHYSSTIFVSQVIHP